MSYNYALNERLLFCGGNMINRLKKKSYFIFIFSVTNTITLMLLFFCLNDNAVLSKTPEEKSPTDIELRIKKQIKAGEAADAISKDGKEKQHISADFLVDLLKEYTSQDKRPSESFHILNAEIDGNLELDGMPISYKVRLENCIFDGDVNFSGSEFQKDLFLNKSTFHGTANFYNIKVGGDFQLDNTTFTNEEKQINLDRINVGGVLHFDDSVVAGPFTLSDSSMKELECTATEFNNYGTQYKETDDGKTTTHEIEGRVNANFYKIKVNGSATFTCASFGGLVNFKSADIGKDLELTGVHFNNDSKDITFGSMKVGGSAIFNETTFAGGFDMSNIEVGGTLSFQGTEANRDNAVKTFYGMKVDNFVFDPATLAPPYSLQDAKYRLLNQSPSVHKDNILDLIKKSEYSPSTYNNLVAYYKSVDLEKKADDVYVTGKLREGRSLSWPNYLLNRLLYLTVGYGKYPGRALLWSLLFIVIGCLVFFCEENMILDKKYEDDNKGKVPPQNSSKLKALLRKLENPVTSTIYRILAYLKTRTAKLICSLICSPDEAVNNNIDFKYNPLWYSIALFLPIVDLEDVKIWAPNPRCKWRRHYMRVHIILGYLLIPIGLAAWTGLIK